MKITKNKLIEALEEFSFKPQASAKKEELKEKLYDVYDQKQLVLLSAITVAEYDIIKRALEAGEEGVDIDISTDVITGEELYFLAKVLILELSSSDEDKIHIRINEELREVLKKCISDDNRIYVEFNEQAATIIRDLVYLYGIIEISELTNRVNKLLDPIGIRFPENVVKTNILINELLKYKVTLAIIEGKEYAFFSIISDPEKVLAERRKRDLTYKDFTNKDLESWRFDLLQKTPEAKELIKYMDNKKKGFGEFSVQLIIFEFMTNPTLEVEKFMQNFLQGCNSLEEATKCASSIINLYNNTPQYVLYGYSPNELFANRKISRKIGRNDPCVCRKRKKI